MGVTLFYAFGDRDEEKIMKTVEPGSVVKLCYKGRVSEVESFDPTMNCQEIQVEVGAGEMMKGFENALLGMGENEKKTFTLDPDEAFGNRDDRLERTFERNELPGDFSAKEGDMISLQTSTGDQILATVKDTNDEQITLDLNHPLAGKSLTFEVEVHHIQ